jgi:hypothetical protein
VWVLAASAGYRLAEYRRDGTRLRELELPRELELVTGLFAAGEDLFIEERHEQQLLVVRSDAPLRGRRPARLLGRPDPSRPGARLLLGREPSRATVRRVLGGRYTSPLLAVATPLPLVAVEELLADGRGGVSLSLLLAEEPASEEDDGWRGARRVLAVARPGAPLAAIELATARAADTRRPLAVAADGTPYELELGEAGVSIRRWPAGGAR